jgi:hypothetical protein
MSSLVPILYIKARDQLDSNVHIILINFCCSIKIKQSRASSYLVFSILLECSLSPLILILSLPLSPRLSSPSGRTPLFLPHSPTQRCFSQIAPFYHQSERVKRREEVYSAPVTRRQDSPRTCYSTKQLEMDYDALLAPPALNMPSLLSFLLIFWLFVSLTKQPQLL